MNKRNPKSGRQYHICPTCGWKFTCTEHCIKLWEKTSCKCSNCDISEPEWLKRCDCQPFDWVEEWVREVIEEKEK